MKKRKKLLALLCAAALMQCLFTVPSFAYFNRGTAVSYTHLDVYKRQVQMDIIRRQRRQHLQKMIRSRFLSPVKVPAAVAVVLPWQRIIR